MMKRPILSHLFTFVAALWFCHPAQAQDKQNDCNLIATEVLQIDGKPTNVQQRQALLLGNVIEVENSPSCLIQAGLSNPDAIPDALAAIAPARVSLFNAIGSLSGSQQQGSSLSSSGGTNAVSKPSGPSALIQEFGGVNATSGTGSSTFQWSPGTMFTNLALTGNDYLCLLKESGQRFPSPCISASLLRNLTPLTFKITANTGAAQTLNGTATNPSSSSPAQPVTVNSKGTSGPGPGFGGLTVQYSFFGSRTKAGVSSLTSQDKSGQSSGKGGASPSLSSTVVQSYATELKALWSVSKALDSCQAYTDWQKEASKNLQPILDKIPPSSSPSSAQILDLQNGIEREYRGLLTKLISSHACQPALDGLKVFYAAILEAKTYEDFTATTQSSAKPEVALEYDLNTPQNKPSYSTVKLTGNWQFGKKMVAPPSSADQSKGSATSTITDPCGAPALGTPKPSKQQKTEARTKCVQQEVADFARKQTGAPAAGRAGASVPTSQGSTPPTAKQLASNAKPLAKATSQPLSLTINGTADIYNAAPPSSVPSGSHLRDIQAGVELAYLFNTSTRSGPVRQFIGPVTAALAYSYQDQTSPAILTGPALSDFTGLPSSTTTAYATRGIIHLGQFRLGLGSGSNTNLTYPIAFTYSNRTELVAHPTWGVQFGISYNLNSLFNSGGATNSAASSSQTKK
jgi:hypothetical protein